MKHLFVTNDFPPKLGGIESYLTNLCSGFDPKDVTVVAPTRPGAEEVDRELPYKVIRLPGTYLRATRRTYAGLVDAVRTRKPKAVHFLAALPLGRLGSRLAAQTGVGWSVVAHGTGEILLPARVPLARRALRKVLMSADVVLPVSEFTRAEVDRVTRNKARTYLLNPAVDTERFSLDVSGFEVRERHGLGRRFVVTFVSRLVKRKGADVLIRAVSGMQGTAALVVGAGPEAASLQRLARESEAADRVVFAGMVPDEQLPSYYAAADVFCMPCTNRYGGLDTEGFGVVYLEAQATGLPCVAGKCGGSSEAVVDGATGVVIEDPTPKSLGEVLVELRKDPARCAMLGGAGRSRMEQEFAPAVIAARLDSAMKEALG